MEIKKLGKNGPEISRIGFGALGIAGYHYGKTDDNESIEAIKKAVELGINFFDTADIYGFGKSEKLLALALRERIKEMVIATKAGARWNEEIKKSQPDLSPSYIKGAIQNSLQNLGIKSIPLYQMHYPDENVCPRETMEALNDLKKEGKIAHIGASNFSGAQLEEYSKYGEIVSAQLAYNILDTEAEDLIFPVCDKLGIGIIAYSPLAQGMLSGKYGKDSVFEENDRRKTSKYFTDLVFSKIGKLFEKMEELSRKYDKTMAQVALRFILDNPSVTAIIVGAKTEGEISEAVGAMGWNLEEDERLKLKNLGKEVME